jgi:hypothetical protein
MGSWRVAAFIGIAGCVCAAVACGAFGSDDASTGGPNQSDGGDALSSSDSPINADVLDAGPSGDSSCSWFCEDFDHGWPTAGWSSASNILGGTIDVTSDVFVSPPKSLRSILPADGGTTIPHALVSRPNFGNVKSVHCEMNLRLDSRAADYSDLVTLEAQSASGKGYLVRLGDNGSKGYTQLDETRVVGSDGFTQFPLGVWLRLGITFSLDTPTRVTVNGAVQNHLKSPTGDAGAEDLTTVKLTLGASRSDGTTGGAWVVDYDDVACEVGN